MREIASASEYTQAVETGGTPRELPAALSTKIQTILEEAKQRLPVPRFEKQHKDQTEQLEKLKHFLLEKAFNGKSGEELAEAAKKFTDKLNRLRTVDESHTKYIDTQLQTAPEGLSDERLTQIEGIVLKTLKEAPLSFEGQGLEPERNVFLIDQLSHALIDSARTGMKEEELNEIARQTLEQTFIAPELAKMIKAKKIKEDLIAMNPRAKMEADIKKQVFRDVMKKLDQEEQEARISKLSAGAGQEEAPEIEIVNEPEIEPTQRLSSDAPVSLREQRLLERTKGARTMEEVRAHLLQDALEAGEFARAEAMEKSWEEEAELDRTISSTETTRPVDLEDYVQVPAEKLASPHAEETRPTLRESYGRWIKRVFDAFKTEDQNTPTTRVNTRSK